jgi:hypothetical protein
MEFVTWTGELRDQPEIHLLSMEIMKNIFAILLIMTLGVTGCDNFLDINDDPNNPVDVSADRILPAVQVNTAFILGKDLNLQTGALVQHLAGTNNQLLSYDLYAFNGTEADNVWLGIFAGALLDLKKIEEISEPNEDVGYSAIAKIQSAYLFGVATDLYGDIPFEQALQDINIVTPEFDTQEDIYNSLIASLQEAVTALETQELGTNPGGADLVYGGDVSRWIRLGNALQLKFWLQQRNVNPTQAATAISSLINSNQLLTGNGDNYSVGFGTSTGNQHPLYDFAYNRRDGDIAISQRFLDSLEAVNDPRIPFYFNDQGQGEYLGFDNGGTGAPPLRNVRARLGEFPVGGNGEAPQRLFTYYTQQFYLAEAALTLDTPGDARDYFEDAIRAALSEAGVGAAETDTYVTDRLAAYDAAADDEAKLAVIIRDKWASNLANGVEAFNDWRRTGYPALIPSTQPQTPDGSIPVRLLYSSNELSSNPNLEEQSLLIDPVWWDVE